MNLKEKVKNLATSLGYEFSYGLRQFHNYETTLKSLKDGTTYILMMPETVRSIYATGKIYISSYEYTFQFQIARKWETGNATKSKLDETYEVKYDLRLSEMKTLADSFVKAFICSENIEPVSQRMNMEINKYAENFDLWNVELIFRSIT